MWHAMYMQCRLQRPVVCVWGHLCLWLAQAEAAIVSGGTCISLFPHGLSMHQAQISMHVTTVSYASMHVSAAIIVRLKLQGPPRCVHSQHPWWAYVYMYMYIIYMCCICVYSKPEATYLSD